MRPIVKDAGFIRPYHETQGLVNGAIAESTKKVPFPSDNCVVSHDFFSFVWALYSARDSVRTSSCLSMDDHGF